jgi:hypothetical protein
MAYDDLDDLFSGGGAPAVKFPTVGSSITGTITALEVRDSKDFDTGEVLTWEDGTPRKELVLTISTSLRDASIEDDDGTRRIFAKGNMFTAVRDSVRKAKAKKPEVGGRITVTYSADGEAKKRGYNPPKLYTAVYEPPSGVQVEAMFDEPEATPAAVPAAVVDINAGTAAQMDDQAALLAQAANLDPAALAKLLGELSDAK